VTIQRRVLLPTTLCALTLAAVLLGCSGQDEKPLAAVSETEARTAVAHVVTLAAQRSQEAMQQLCTDNDGCPGMSSSIEHEPLKAPGPDRAPRELCTVALPATPSQAGSRIVVLEGTDGEGRAYVTQVLVDRAREAEDDEDGFQVQEPGFWLGIHYTALQHGRSWSGGNYGPAQPEVDNELAGRACTDTDSWLTSVATRSAG
jgi:hypothetical protein